MRPSTIMTTATQLSERTEIDYPDSDGLPVADNASVSLTSTSSTGLRNTISTTRTMGHWIAGC
jgi:hypothetical protein